MKKCFKCGVEKELSEFYAHPRMADGHLGKCKDCNKRDVRCNREKKIEYYLAYDKLRFRNSERRKLSHKRAFERRRLLHPEKEVAHYTVSNAVRDGRLIKQPCEVCGNPKSEAHHPDYSKPLDVRWLCFVHHRMEHGNKHFSKAA